MDISKELMMIFYDVFDISLMNHQEMVVIVFIVFIVVLVLI